MGWPYGKCLEKGHVLRRGPIPCLKAAITQEVLRMNKEDYSWNPKRDLLETGLISRWQWPTYAQGLFINASLGAGLLHGVKNEAALWSWSAIWRDLVMES